MKKKIVSAFCMGFVLILPVLYVIKKTQFLFSWLEGKPISDSSIKSPCHCEENTETE